MQKNSSIVAPHGSAWSRILVAFVCIATLQFTAARPSDADSTEVPARPNVLFIAIDDLRPELGCYGVKEIKTPKIDALAASGITFNRAYCQLAVCNPSRVSLLTGLRPDSSKVWDLVTRFRQTVPDVVTLPQQFKKHGYHAVSFGKIFHNPWPDNVSWSEPHRWPEKSSLWSDAAKRRHAEYKEKMRAEGRPERTISRIRPQATEIVDVPDNEHIDGAIAQQALAAMKRLSKQDQPFFLAAGFVRPHLPFVVPRKYWELYEADAIPAAANPVLPKDAPAFSMNTMYELRDYIDFDGTPAPNQGSLTEEQRRRLKHGYYASVSFIDSLVGRLLAELKSLGLADNTIVVLWGDHGWKLGEHNSWCKQTNYEIDAHVPLIIRAPQAETKGRTTNALVEFVDIYPTLCELAGLPLPKHLEGKSMVPLLSKPDRAWKQAAFSQFRRQDGNVPLMGYAMRTDRYRYIEWLDRRTREVVATELYDHDSDALENANIAGVSENKNRLAEMSRQMWAALPMPPKYIPPKSRRPQAIFQNRGDVPLTLFWIKPDGGERQEGVIQPGTKILRNTTLGHQFRVRGPDGFSKTFEVKKQRQIFEIKHEPTNAGQSEERRPNIVFCMADDWSWPHARILGDPVVKTPYFDRVAREGVLFENAFVSTPSCTPSRLSILTGQHHWRLKEGDSLGGSLREEFDVYTEVLQNAGYRIGRFGKGVWPSKHAFRHRDSFGERFRSFDEFLHDRNADQPFCYWHGGQDPHRPYDLNVGAESGIQLSEVKVPACLPDNQTVRSDVADYLWEVQRFDHQVGEIITKLEAIGELDNTILVVSGDNGMPFPRCKATLYDQGTRVPLAVRWGAKVPGRRTVADFVSLCDLAPTFLEAAGLKPSQQMTGRSLLPVLTSKKFGQVDPARTFVLTGMEQHVYSYPARALRTKDFLYIRNFDPDKWPTGEVEGHNPEYNFAAEPWPTERGAFSFNIDPSPSKQILRLHRNEKDTKRFANLAFSRRPQEELYDLRKDPDQLHNVASDADHADTKQQLRHQLDSELVNSGDPRLVDNEGSPGDVRKPNVLFISVDDLNDWVGCLGGHPQAKTPNIDRLAASGTLFTNAHCTAPACNPSRTAIMTGISPHKSGLYDNRQKMREILPNAELLPKYFSRHGYWSAGSGKILHYFIDAASWDDYYPSKDKENPFPRTLYPEKRPVSLPRGGPWQYVETDWGALDATDEEFGGDWLVSKWVGEQLSKTHDKPFFLACGIYRPHEPWFVPKKYFDQFPLESIQLPSGYKEDDLDDLPPAGKRRGPNRYFAHIQKHKQWKQGIQGYLASIAFADTMVGRVTDALENGPNNKNSIVVLWSDHGWHLGEKQHWQKFTPWRVCTRVPLIFRIPAGVPGLPKGATAGSTCAKPVNLLSLFPTLTQLAGLPDKSDNDGPSLVPLLKDPKAEWPHASITYLGDPGSYGLSTEHWRLIHYASDDEELYDSKADRYEWKNLATTPVHAAKLAELRKLGPTSFAPKVAASVESLPKLKWRAAEEAPASRPDGDPFDVFFINQRKQPVKLFWMDGQGEPKPYGTIPAGNRKRQQTRPGAVWLITDSADKPIGHFIIGDRTAKGVIPSP